MWTQFLRPRRPGVSCLRPSFETFACVPSAIPMNMRFAIPRWKFAGVSTHGLTWSGSDTLEKCKLYYLLQMKQPRNNYFSPSFPTATTDGIASSCEGRLSNSIATMSWPTWTTLPALPERCDPANKRDTATLQLTPLKTGRGSSLETRLLPKPTCRTPAQHWRSIMQASTELKDVPTLSLTAI